MADQGTARKTDEAGDVLQELRGELRRLLDETDRLSGDIKIDPDRGVDFRQELARYQRDLILQALRLAKGKQKEAARLLNLSPSSLHVKLRSLDIDPKNL